MNHTPTEEINKSEYSKVEPPAPELLDAGIREVISYLWERGYTTVFSCSGLFEEHKDRLVEFAVGDKKITHIIKPNIIFGMCTAEQELRLKRAAKFTRGTYIKDPIFAEGNPTILWPGFNPLAGSWIISHRLKDKVIKLQFRIFKMLV